MALMAMRRGAGDITPSTYRLTSGSAYSHDTVVIAGEVGELSGPECPIAGEPVDEEQGRTAAAHIVASKAQDQPARLHRSTMLPSGSRR